MIPAAFTKIYKPTPNHYCSCVRIGEEFNINVFLYQLRICLNSKKICFPFYLCSFFKHFMHLVPNTHFPQMLLTCIL